MIYTIYKITNLLNNKIYIGKHVTNSINDDYMGSGKLIKATIEKYGLENFEKEILFVFDSEDDMNAKEAELVTEEFVKKDTNYNLCPGGHGGWGYVNQQGLGGFFGPHTNEAKRKIKKFRKSYKHSSETIKKISEANIKTNESRGKKTSAALKGKPKSEEHKKKISQSLKGNKNLKGKKFPNRKKRDPIVFEIVKCPHCNKSGKKNAMNRWHFDNCSYAGKVFTDTCLPSKQK
jgi:hypothetical protein